MNTQSTANRQVNKSRVLVLRRRYVQKLRAKKHCRRHLLRRLLQAYRQLRASQKNCRGVQGSRLISGLMIVEARSITLELLDNASPESFLANGFAPEVTKEVREVAGVERVRFLYLLWSYRPSLVVPLP